MKATMSLSCRDCKYGQETPTLDIDDVNTQHYQRGLDAMQQAAIRHLDKHPEHAVRYTEIRTLRYALD